MISTASVDPPTRPRFWARIAPALLLVILAPLIAEFLLGDFSVRSLYVLPFVLPLYGGGALTIREVTRRTGRGWPTIVLLAIAYGVFEEGITTMSLFNPHYAGQHLLAYGYLPALGTSFDWDVFVVGIHAVFSISTPILIAEGVAGPRRTEPWLGRLGLGVAIGLFALGALLTTATQIGGSHFVATIPQLVAVVVLVVILAAAAFVATRRIPAPAPSTAPWTVWLAFPVVLALLSAFELVQRIAAPVPAWVPAVAMTVLLGALAAVVWWWSHRPGWDPMGYLAVAAGAAGTYSWLSLYTFVVRGRTDLGVPTGPVDVAGQVVLVLLVFGLIALGIHRNRPAAIERSTGLYNGAGIVGR